MSAPAAAARRALAIHPGALGDVLLAIPALRALRDAGGGIALAGQAHIAALLAALGEVDEARDLESLGLHALFAGEERARLPPADRVVCWFGARDPDFARRLTAQAPGAIVAPSTGEGLVWRHLLRTCGAPGLARRAPVRVDARLVTDGRACLTAAGWDGARRLLLVHPGAGSAGKRWPAEAFAAVLRDVARRSDLAVVLHEGPADTDAVEALLARVPSALRLRRPALPTLAGALADCAAWLGNDSGVTHLAAAAGAPTVALFAAANLAWRPWAPDAGVLIVDVTRIEAAEVEVVRGALRRRLG